MDVHKLIRRTLQTSMLTFAVMATMTAARATEVTFDLNVFHGADADVRVTVNDAVVANHVRLTINVLPTPNIGDLRSLYFNFNNGILPDADLTLSDFTGGLITDKAFNTHDLGGNTFLPLSNFHVGLEFGTAGIVANDIQTATVLIDTTNTNINATSFDTFAARLNDVGTGWCRDDYSKLIAYDPQSTVPEPTTYVLMGTGLVGFALLARRRNR